VCVFFFEKYIIIYLNFFVHVWLEYKTYPNFRQIAYIQAENEWIKRAIFRFDNF
jgi:hypothetical protein